jgi:hypothetical protein
MALTMRAEIPGAIYGPGSAAAIPYSAAPAIPVEATAREVTAGAAAMVAAVAVAIEGAGRATF